jgi:hypothetical protein
MGSSELADALGVSIDQVDKVIGLISRFLLGDDRGFRLMHAEFRRAVADRLRPKLSAYEESLLTWCKSYEVQQWPDETPNYVLLYYASHLVQARDSHSLFALIGRHWMELKATRTLSHNAFASDVLLAIEQAAAESPSDLFQEIRCSLIYANLGSSANSVPVEAYDLLTTAGQLGRVMGYAAMVPEPKQRGGLTVPS